MLEKQGIRKSLGRSAKLVHGSWWRVFGIQLLAFFIANVVAAIIGIPFGFIGAALGGDGVSGLLTAGDLGWTFLIVSGLGSVIASMVTFPITAGVTVLLVHRPAHPPGGPRPRPGPRRRRAGSRRRHPRELIR